MRRTLHRRAGKGALAATVTMLALGLGATSAPADKGGVPHAGSNGRGAQEPESPPPAAEQPAAPAQEQGREDGQAHPAKPAKRHKAKGGGEPVRPERPARPKQSVRPAAREHASNANPGKTTICHRTGSEKHPWVQITIADRALPAHRRHGDLVPAPAGGCPKPQRAGSETAAPEKTKEHGRQGKTTICHRTGSQSNPWVRITVANPSLKAHRAHGDLIPAPAEGCAKPQETPAPEPTPAPPPADEGSLGPGGFPVEPTPTALAVRMVGANSVTPASNAALAPSQAQPAATGQVLAESVSSPARGTASSATARTVVTRAASTAPTATAAAARTSSRGLPFTGWPALLLALGGAGALLAGVALRRAHRLGR